MNFYLLPKGMVCYRHYRLTVKLKCAYITCTNVLYCIHIMRKDLRRPKLFCAVQICGHLKSISLVFVNILTLQQRSQWYPLAWVLVKYHQFLLTYNIQRCNSQYVVKFGKVMVWKNFLAFQIGHLLAFHGLSNMPKKFY